MFIQCFPFAVFLTDQDAWACFCAARLIELDFAEPDARDIAAALSRDPATTARDPLTLAEAYAAAAQRRAVGLQYRAAA